MDPRSREVLLLRVRFLRLLLDERLVVQGREHHDSADPLQRGERVQRTHERRMERNWRVVMMVAKSSAPNSRMVYRTHSCPHVDAAESTSTSVSDSGWFSMNATACPWTSPRRARRTRSTPSKKFTQSIWLQCLHLVPAKSLSWNVDVKPSNPRYPSARCRKSLCGPPSASFAVVDRTARRGCTRHAAGDEVIREFVRATVDGVSPDHDGDHLGALTQGLHGEGDGLSASYWHVVATTLDADTAAYL